MTNADYYVNVYCSGWTGEPQLTRNDADKAQFTSQEYIDMEGHRIGVWHVRLKSNAAR